jgi:uncharacterized protein YkwD
MNRLAGIFCAVFLFPVSLTAADGPTGLDRKLVESLKASLVRGAVVFNDGDSAGCCRLFEGALTTLKPLMDHRPELQKEIERGAEAAQAVADVADRAFKLRTTLFNVLRGLDPSIKEEKPPVTPVTPVTPVKAELFELSAEERDVVDLTNRERAARGLPALRPDPKLFAAARMYSAVMARFNRMGHSVDGSALGGRVNSAGYGWSSVAENVAAGQQSPSEAVSSWMNSSGHRSNLLGRHSDIGIGVAVGANGTRYWAQVFASP